MGLSVNGPGGSLFGLRQLERNAQGVQDAQGRLASLLRINRAADDAAGLAIAEGFRAQVRQVNTEIRSIQSGINFTQTAEGGLSAQNDAIGRIRELAVQASNGTLNADQRAALNAEAQQLVQGIDQIAQNTEFNGLRPLDGSTGSVALDTSGSLDVQVAESSASSLNLNTIDLSTEAGARAALGVADSARDQVVQNRASIGAQERGLGAAIVSRENTALNAQESESRLRDLDVAQAFVDQTRNQVLLQTGIAALAQGNVPAQNAASLLGS